MSAGARKKGVRGEREAELAFQAAGFTTERAIGGRNQISGDVLARLGDTELAVEVRRREKLSVERWLHEHRASCNSHSVPILVTRTSRNPWMVAIELDDFLSLFPNPKESEPR